MSADPALARVVELAASVDALAALAAVVRIESEGLDADPAVRDLLTRIGAELTAGAAPADPAALLGIARTVLLQAQELVDNPGRSGSWDRVDVPVLQSIGRQSMSIVSAFAAAGRARPELDARLRTPGARFLDVGTGTGWLAIAVARAYPQLAVTGIDLFAPALDLARANVAEAGLTDRVTLTLQDALDLEPDASYDAVWLALPFLPGPIVPAVLERAHAALRPGGWVLPGTFAGPDTPLAHLLTDLKTVRAGGHPWASAELTSAMADAGFADAREIERSWPAPVRLYAGRRAH